MAAINWTIETPFLIIVNYYDGDVTWTGRLIQPHLIYYKDRPDQAPFTAANKAKSETNLLKFVSDFYDELPQNLITVHQYEYKSLHQGSLVDILNAPDFQTQYAESLTPGYWNFNNYTISNIQTELPTLKASGWWEACMEPFFGPIEGYGDFAAGKKGAAQFVVSRDRIRTRPRIFYQNMYDWLVTHTIDETPTGFDPVTKGRILTPTFRHPLSNFFTSRYLEWSWELIFTAYQPSQKITQQIGDMEVAARYGNGTYDWDVTTAVIRYYFKPDGSWEIDSTPFNSLFGDPISGVVKRLLLQVNGIQMEFNEDRNFKLRLGNSKPSIQIP